jgi:hypothetical protein
MDQLPIYVSLIFIGVCVSVFGFILYAAYWSLKGKRIPLILFANTLLGWLFLTGYLTFNGFFQDFNSFPPRLFLFVGPIILFIFFVLLYPRSREAVLQMPITTLTYIHIVRIPVELCLWWLFGAGLVAQAMTFEGANFDILAGITAPFAGVFLVGRKVNNKWGAIIWNLVCLGLVLNIVVRAIALTPYFYDGSGSELQNLAVFQFPFVWLPIFVVPAVIFSHVVSLLILLKKEKN